MTSAEVTPDLESAAARLSVPETLQPHPGLIRQARAQLRSDHTVDRALVHRASIHEVFLTDAVEVGSETFAVSVQWPRRHHLATWTTPEPLAPDLVIEAVRQIGLMLPHCYLGVPLDAVYLAHSLGFQWTGQVPRGVDCAMDAVAIAKLVQRKQGRSRVFDLVVHLAAPDGSVFAIGTGSMTTVSPALFRRLRGRAALASSAHLPLPEGLLFEPQEVGRTRADQVVLLRPSLAAQANQTTPSHPRAQSELRIDPTDPFYFDHPYDHVPATLLLAGMGQAAAALRAGDAPAGVHADFDHYVELVPRPLIEVHACGEFEVRAVVRQDGRTLATGLVAFE